MAADQVFVPLRHAGSSVVAPLLNWPRDLADLGEAAFAPPHKAPPKAPVLYLRPRNTWALDGDDVTMPQGVEELLVGASLAGVIGRAACAVSPQAALDHVAAWVVVNDLSIPHASYYRPALPQRCRDGFCPISQPVPRAAVRDPDDLSWRVLIDGVEAEQGRTAGALRPFAQLLSDVSEFMTLLPGDLLLLGSSNHGPLVRPGQQVRIEFDGLPSLSNRFVRDAGRV